jgi:predicted MFS family arabinose efflux permease
VLTVLAVANQTIAVIGPSLGGLLIGLGGWRTTFAVNIPLALAAFVLAFLRFPTVTARQSSSAAESKTDYLGIVAFAGMLVSALLFLMTPRVSDIYLLAIAVVAGAVLVVRELRTRDPFIDLRMLGGNLPLVATYVRSVLAATVSYSFLYGFTQWLEDGRGLSASTAGLVLLPVFGMAIVVSAATGRRAEIRGKLLFGAVFQVLACALMLALHATTAIWLLLGLALIMGVPQGLLSLANQNAVYRQADPARMGSSAGLLRMFSYLGALISSSADGIVYGHTADTSGMHRLALFVLVVSVVLVLMTVLDRSLKNRGARLADAGKPENTPNLLDAR